MGNEYDENWVQTACIKKFYFLNPNPDDIIIDDIAHALSLQCRFGGHIPRFYSVAEHSCRMAGLLENAGYSSMYQLAGLLHDAEEAYLPDIPRPVKHVMPEAHKIYKTLNDTIMKKFSVKGVDWGIIKEYDDRMCVTEAQSFGLWHSDWADLGEPLDFRPIGWHPEEAERVFLELMFYIGSSLNEEKKANRASVIQKTNRGRARATRGKK